MPHKDQRAEDDEGSQRWQKAKTFALIADAIARIVDVLVKR